MQTKGFEAKFVGAPESYGQYFENMRGQKYQLIKSGKGGTMKKIPIDRAREIAKAYGCDMLIIYGFAAENGELTGEFAQTTYGKNKELCGKTKELADRLIEGSGL